MQDRRTFLGGMFVAVGAVGLVGCIDQPGTTAWTGIVAAELVPVRPGMRYANVLPGGVPAVRRARTLAAH
jgi:hypothetical protein